MLTAEGCVARRARLWEAMPTACDALVIAAPEHINYFTNFCPSPFTYRTTNANAVLILRPGRATLVADDQLRPFAEEAHVDERDLPTWYDGTASAGPRHQLVARAALGVLETLPGGCLGIELGAVPAGISHGLRQGRPDLDVVDLDPIIRPLRRAKDADELALIRRSIRAIEAGMAAALASLKPGMTEFEAYRLIEDASLAAAGERAIVYGDFVSGPRSANRLGPPTDRRLDAGDLFILDFSVVIRGYRGDFANTICVGGRPSPRQREMYDACMAAMAAGEALLAPGARGRDLFEAVRAAFADRGLADLFRSHAGHGVGLGHPEPPYFVPRSDDDLRAGDVVTLEPGLYEDGLGGMRFERNYLITPDGFETLTQHRLALAE